MRASELTTFKKLLLERRRVLSGNVQSIEDEALKKSRQSASGDLSTMPYHMADIGTDTFAQEFTLGMLESEEGELRAIDRALEKIGDGTYGKCEACSKTIGKNRLKVMPHARLCIACKRKEETESGVA